MKNFPDLSGYGRLEKNMSSKDSIGFISVLLSTVHTISEVIILSWKFQLILGDFGRNIPGCLNQKVAPIYPVVR